MTFESILYKVKELSEECIFDFLNGNDIDLVYDDDLTLGKESLIVSSNCGTCIFIKNGLDDKREQFLILHEIGHFILHKDCSKLLCSASKMEHEANMFACLYLIKCDITSAQYYDTWLINNGVPNKVATDFQESLYQFRQMKKYDDKWLRMEI